MTDATLPLRQASQPIEGSGQEEIAAFAARQAPVRLIYIVGYGRSGTTLLDIALGEHPAIMGAGEVAALARHVWDNEEYCACGQPVRECSHWKEIVDAWQDGEPPDFLRRYRQAQERTEGLASIARFPPLPGWRDHVRRTLKLLRGMAVVSRRAILVDSSKLPGRGFALALMPGIDLAVVHVVRDGRGVAWSLLKGYGRSVADGLQRELRPKPLLYTAARWAMVNIAAEWLCRRVGPERNIRIRYEDFVEDPYAVIGRILALVGERPQISLAQPIIFAPQHQVAGSRHRMRKMIELRPDDKWKRDMPVAKQRLFTLLCAPLLRRYGYPLRLTGKGAS